jgi:hypothetical protein
LPKTELSLDTGLHLGCRYVLLTHESGWEFFIPVAIKSGKVAGTYLAAKAGEKVLGKALESTLRSLLSFMRQKWLAAVHGGVRIDHIEIRTLAKGVMKLPFSDFGIDQLECLLAEFNSISHIRECNERWFFGNLVEASDQD